MIHKLQMMRRVLYSLLLIPAAVALGGWIGGGMMGAPPRSLAPPPSGGGVACVYGGPAPTTPNLATTFGAPPVCIMYFDFTTMSTATMQSLIQCTGGWTAASPVFVLQSIQGNTMPCSDVKLITDGSVQVLDTTLTAAQGAAGNGDTHLGSIMGVSDLPYGTFTEVTFKFPASTYANNALGSFAEMGAQYYYGITSGGNLGSDNMEIYCQPASSGCTTGGSVGQAETNYNDGSRATGGTLFASLDSSVYHKLSFLDTTDGSSSAAICVYVDQAKNTGANSCEVANTGYLTGLGAGPVSTILAARMLMNLTDVGPQTFQIGSMRGNYDIYTKVLAIWGCANWRTTGCPIGATITSAPNY